MKKFNLIVCLLALVVTANSCKDKDEPTAQGTYEIRMTDAPGPYTAVYVDIQAVEITGAGTNPVMMNVNAGVYDLIKLANGKDTLLATATLDVTTIQQIRLILGPNNSVVRDSVTYPLSTPSGQQSGLKLNVHHRMQPGVTYHVLLDFDANASIVEQGTGEFSLKPVIRTVENAQDGSIKGHISVPGVTASVKATSASGAVYSSNVTANGDFLIMGLPSGTYTVEVTPAAPYSPVTISNVSVTTGVATNVGLVTL